MKMTKINSRREKEAIEYHNGLTDRLESSFPNLRIFVGSFSNLCLTNIGDSSPEGFERI